MVGKNPSSCVAFLILGSFIYIANIVLFNVNVWYCAPIAFRKDLGNVEVI